MLFEKNIDALKPINPKLAEKLSLISIDEAKENIGVFNAESGDLIIAIGEQALDSIYDPIRESKTIWNRNVQTPPQKNDIQTVFGLGLGYLFKRVYISCESRILVYEPHTNVLRFVLEYIDLTNELKDKRVYVTDDYCDCLNYLNEKFLSGDNLHLHFSKYYAAIAKDTLTKLSGDIYKVCEQKNFDTNTILKLTKFWIPSTINNIKTLKNTSHFGALEGRFKGKTAVIAAAGPSLEENMDIIKKNRDKFVLISVNRALNPLLENGIKPDFTAFMDVRDFSAYMKNNEEQIKELNFISDIRAGNFAYKSQSASKFVYLCPNIWVGSSINSAIKEIKTYKSAGSVSITCYYIARALGCSDIVFAGLDLALKNDRLYTVSKEPENQIPVPKSINFSNIKNKDGRDVKTKDDYAAFVRQLEQILEEENDSNVYNTTSFGAYIKGMNYKSLDEILENKSPLNLDIQKIVKEACAENEQLWDSAKAHLKDVLQNEKKLAEILSDTVEPCLEKTKHIIDELESKSNANVHALLKIQQQGISTIINELVKSQILFEYYQQELLEYSNKNSKDALFNIKDLKKFKQKEIELLESLKSVIPRFISSYDNAIANI